MLDRRRFAVFLSGFTAFLTLYATQPLLPEIAATFGASVTAASLTIAMGTLGVATMAPLAGSLSDMFGRKRMIIGAIGVLLLPSGLAAAAHSLGELMLWRFVQGLCLPSIFAVTVAYVGEEWGPAEAPKVAPLYVSGTIVGGFAGRVTAGLVGEQFGWRAALCAQGVLLVLLGVAIWRWLPTERRFQPLGGGIAGSLAALARHMHNLRLLVVAGIGFVMLFSLVAIFTYANLMLAAAPFSLAPGALGAIFTVYLLGAVVTPLSGGWITRWGERATMGIGFAISLTGLVLTLASAIWVIMVGLALAACGMFVVQAVNTGMIPRVAPVARSAAVGLYVTTYYIGGSIGAVLPGPVWHHFGWPGCVLLFALVELAGFALTRLGLASPAGVGSQP